VKRFYQVTASLCLPTHGLDLPPTGYCVQQWRIKISTVNPQTTCLGESRNIFKFVFELFLTFYTFPSLPPGLIINNPRYQSLNVQDVLLSPRKPLGPDVSTSKYRPVPSRHF
jgi:hypothetical protein